MTLAAGVWAAGKEKAGTVVNGTNCAGGSTTVFSKLASCSPADSDEASNAATKFYSRIYTTTLGQEHACFAYPPAFAKNDVRIFVYSDGSWSNSVQSEITGSPAQICATLPVGSIFALMGNK